MVSEDCCDAALESLLGRLIDRLCLAGDGMGEKSDETKVAQPVALVRGEGGQKELFVVEESALSIVTCALICTEFGRCACK